MDAAARQAVMTMQHFKPQEIANTLWSFATLGHDPKEQLLDAMGIQMIARIQQFRPQVSGSTPCLYFSEGDSEVEVKFQHTVKCEASMG